MSEIRLNPIGKITSDKDGFRIVLEKKYRKGLNGLSGYSHVQVLWWMDRVDTSEDRSILVETKPYSKGPEEIGVFAMRSPERPNPIGVSSVGISYLDEEEGVVGLYYIDAFPESLVLDLKPYTPSIDRVEHSVSPSWCSHWPRSYEESASFDWSDEFNF